MDTLADMAGRSDQSFAHLGLCYENLADYVAGVVPFVENALAEKTPVMIAVPGERLDLVREHLGAAADDILLADMAVEGRNPGWILPGVLLDFANRHPDQPVAMVGEPIWPDRSVDEYPACVVHEALINEAFAGRDGAVLCPYDVANLEPAVVKDAHQTHPVMIANGATQSSAQFVDPYATVAEFRNPLPNPPAVAAAMTYRHPADLTAVRRFVTKEATRAGFDSARATDVAVAVNELASNTIEHTAGGGRIAVWSDDEAFICQVADGGHIADPLAGYVLPPPSERRGRGLVLVNRASDLVRMHTHSGGTTFRAFFYR